MAMEIDLRLVEELEESGATWLSAYLSNLQGSGGTTDGANDTLLLSSSTLELQLANLSGRTNEAIQMLSSATDHCHERLTTTITPLADEHIEKWRDSIVTSESTLHKLSKRLDVFGFNEVNSLSLLKDVEIVKSRLEECQLVLEFLQQWNLRARELETLLRSINSGKVTSSTLGSLSQAATSLASMKRCAQIFACDTDNEEFDTKRRWVNNFEGRFLVCCRQCIADIVAENKIAECVQLGQVHHTLGQERFFATALAEVLGAKIAASFKGFDSIGSDSELTGAHILETGALSNSTMSPEETVLMAYFEIVNQKLRDVATLSRPSLAAAIPDDEKLTHEMMIQIASHILFTVWAAPIRALDRWTVPSSTVFLKRAAAVFLSLEVGCNVLNTNSLIVDLQSSDADEKNFWTAICNENILDMFPMELVRRSGQAIASYLEGQLIDKFPDVPEISQQGLAQNKVDTAAFLKTLEPQLIQATHSTLSILARVYDSCDAAKLSTDESVSLLAAGVSALSPALLLLLDEKLHTFWSFWDKVFRWIGSVANVHANDYKESLANQRPGDVNSVPESPVLRGALQLMFLLEADISASSHRVMRSLVLNSTQSWGRSSRFSETGRQAILKCSEYCEDEAFSQKVTILEDLSREHDPNVTEQDCRALLPRSSEKFLCLLTAARETAIYCAVSILERLLQFYVAHDDELGIVGSGEASALSNDPPPSRLITVIGDFLLGILVPRCELLVPMSSGTETPQRSQAYTTSHANLSAQFLHACLARLEVAMVNNTTTIESIAPVGLRQLLLDIVYLKRTLMALGYQATELQQLAAALEDRLAIATSATPPAIAEPS